MSAKKEIRRKLIHELEDIEINICEPCTLHDGTRSSMERMCKTCPINKRIRSIGESLAPSHVDICTQSGLTIPIYKEKIKRGMRDPEIASEFMFSLSSLKKWKNKNCLDRKGMVKS